MLHQALNATWTLVLPNSAEAYNQDLYCKSKTKANQNKITHWDTLCSKHYLIVAECFCDGDWWEILSHCKSNAFLLLHTKLKMSLWHESTGINSKSLGWQQMQKGICHWESDSFPRTQNFSVAQKSNHVFPWHHWMHLLGHRHLQARDLYKLELMWCRGRLCCLNLIWVKI